MPRSALLLILIPAAIIGITLYVNLPMPTPSTEEVSASPSVYAKYCKDCHGTNGRDFLERNWKLGSRKIDIQNVIKKGYPLLGMPEYESVLTSAQIDSLANFVLDQAKKTRRFHPTGPHTESLSGLHIRADVLVNGLDTPWGMDFTPDGGLLFTEREGRLWLMKNGVTTAVEGLPEDIHVRGQGGLLDVAFWTDPHEGTSWVYLTYSADHPEDSELSATALVRGIWTEKEGMLSLSELSTLFVATPYEKTHHHYGSRIVFGTDGMIYLSCGERGKRDVHPQNLETRPGKIHRLHPDGHIPKDNPFTDASGNETSIFTWGHRNPQGMFVHPETGEIWTHEHGPKGGDEINILRRGANYGWPLITFGRNYSGTVITRDTARVGLEQPLHYWLPSIGACGFEIIHGGTWPDAWQGQLLAGSLSFEYLECLTLDQEGHVTKSQKLLEGIGRVRDIARSPHGDIIVAIEGAGAIYRLTPQIPE